ASDSAATGDASEDRGPGAAPLDAAVGVEAATIVEAAVADTTAEGASPVDAKADVTPPLPDAGPGTLSVGLVAYYPFDETSGTAAADGSGNGHTALMHGATFTTGRRGNAATMDGSGQYVSLPIGIVAGLTSCSFSLWANLVSTSSLIHIFDFGSGTTTYVSLSSSKFAITVGNLAGEETVPVVPTLAASTWHHVVITLAGAVATVYVDGQQVGHNLSMTLTPSSLGMTTQNWIGKSQDPTDLFLNGKVDQFRIYGRALTVAEIQQLFQLKL
ncbi:MAG: LamG domain-containing protein, partial [Myxococcota bacterium]|nr:LamG domain-containing protein [Myxococcota bacterium]